MGLFDPATKLVRAAFREYEHEIDRLAAENLTLRDKLAARPREPRIPPAPEPAAVERAVEDAPGEFTLSRNDMQIAGRIADVLATELLNAAHVATADSRYYVTIAVHEQLAELAGLLGLRVCSACTLLPAVAPTNSPEDEIERARRLA